MSTEGPYTAVTEKLLATSAVTALVTDRVWSRLAPTKVWERMAGSTTFDPFIVVKRPRGSTRNHLLKRRDTFQVTPLVIYCMADSHLTASRVADAVMNAIDSDSTEQTGTQTWATYSVDRCEITDAYDASQDPMLGDEIGFPIEAIEINLYHNC